MLHFVVLRFSSNPFCAALLHLLLITNLGIRRAPYLSLFNVCGSFMTIHIIYLKCWVNICCLKLIVIFTIMLQVHKILTDNTWREITRRWKNNKQKKANQISPRQHLYEFGKKFSVLETFPIYLWYISTSYLINKCMDAKCNVSRYQKIC